ncbi:hypothetical protein WN55_05791 [Dufourea novaeangliae]|uniref:Uncharacterized protein n=1 Tax=Dufourea novaeangliae TaxID=178035 RepID=A0A154P0B0_DUFNO|nr:hypothetical protein WN55_05791 [Dufourea novaeangliae]
MRVVHACFREFPTDRVRGLLPPPIDHGIAGINVINQRMRRRFEFRGLNPTCTQEPPSFVHIGPMGNTAVGWSGFGRRDGFKVESTLRYSDNYLSSREIRNVTDHDSVPATICIPRDRELV